MTDRELLIAIARALRAGQPIEEIAWLLRANGWETATSAGCPCGHNEGGYPCAIDAAF